MRVEVHGVLQVVHLQVVDDGRALEGERRCSEGHAVTAARDVRRDVEHPAERLGRLGVGVLDVQVQVGTDRHRVQLARVDPVHELHDAERRTLIVPGVVQASVGLVVPRPDGNEAAVVENEAGRRLPVGDEAGEDDGRPSVTCVVAGIGGRARIRLTGITDDRRRGGRATRAADTTVGLDRLPAEVHGRAVRARVEPRPLVPVLGVRAEALQDGLDPRVIAPVHAVRDVHGQAPVVPDVARDVEVRRLARVRRRAAHPARTTGRGRGDGRRRAALAASPCVGRSHDRAAGTGGRRCRGRGATDLAASPCGRSGRPDLVVHHVADENASVRRRAGREGLSVAVVARHARRSERVRVGATVELAGRERLVVPAEAREGADRTEIAAVELRLVLHQVLGRGRGTAAARGEGRDHRQRDDDRNEGMQGSTVLPFGRAHVPTPFSRLYRDTDVKRQNQTRIEDCSS